MKPLVNIEEVSNLDVGSLLWLDARFRLGDSQEGKRSFLLEHIPSAKFVDLEIELSGIKTGQNGRHPLPERSDLEALFSRLGIDENTHVIVYDDSDHAGAGRLWALLLWMGHEKVQVLHGGLAAWKKAGHPTEKGEVLESWPKKFVGRSPLIKFLTKEHLKGKELIDVRAPERYRGEVEPLDPRAGHIPGAKNIFYKKFLQADGMFLSEHDLKKIFQFYTHPVFYCGSGVTATVALLAAFIAKVDASMYPGSWSEWSQDPHAPLEKN